MNNILPNNLIQYFGSNTFDALKFIRNLAKNLNNSRKISDTVNNKDTIEGYVIGINSLSGLYNNPKELVVTNSRNYYIRFFINIYNKLTRELYGNTYRSPLFPVEIDQNNLIEFDIKNPFCFYVLSQEPKHENLIVQIILVETNKDEVILKEKCQGWVLLSLNKKKDKEKDKEKNKNDNEKIIAEINRGTPRDLIYRNDFIQYPGAKMSYSSFRYPNLELINYLFPTNIILSYNESLPGLRLRNLPQFPDLNENLKTVDFISAYIKNIVIEINPDLEEGILNFWRQYRLRKYQIQENEFNKIYIKERRIKCGMHNTWKFINSNGIQNSISLIKISKNKLQSNGVLMVDRFFADALSCSAIIIELEYVITIPINGPQKEENLNIILGYHLYVPEKINEGNYSKEKLLMLTGPGNTIYGEKMFNLENVGNNEIKISYVLSQNANLNYINQVEIDDLKKQTINATENALIDQNNQMILKGVQNNINNKENEAEKIKDKIKEQLEMNNRLNNEQIEKLKKELAKAEEEKNKMELKLKQKELNNKNVISGIYAQKTNEKKFDNISNTPLEYQKEKNIFPFEESIEYKEFIQFKEKKEIYVKELEEKMEALKEIQKPKVSDYENPIKNISARDKSNLIKKGILDLDLKEEVDSKKGNLGFRP